MININYGNNKELMKHCSKLEEYAIFVHQIRMNTKKGMRLNKAIDEAIFYCIDQGILIDYLKKHRFRARMYGMLEMNLLRLPVEQILRGFLTEEGFHLL